MGQLLAWSMDILLLIAIAFYISLMPLFFQKWTALWQQKPSLSIAAKPIGVVLVAIATLFWPFVIPFAYLDLLEHSVH